MNPSEWGSDPERQQHAVETVAKALADGAVGCTGGCSKRPCDVDYRAAERIVARLLSGDE